MADTSPSVGFSSRACDLYARGAVLLGLASDRLGWPCGLGWFWSADLDCLGGGCASDAVLGGCNFDEPRAGVFEADGAGGGSLLGLLAGGDFAGAARGSGGASLKAPGSGRGRGDRVRHPYGGGEATGDSASVAGPADTGRFRRQGRRCNERHS